MAKGRSPRAQSGPTPPDDWTPTQAVADPILNSPFEEPKAHWLYQRASGVSVPYEQSGRRRASYYFKTQKTGSAQQEFFTDVDSDDLPLVNALRKDVARWRQAGYRGATPVTKDLFAYWSRADRPRRLFFCQLEAAETLIYLLEMAIPGRLASTGYRAFEADAETVGRLLRGEKPRFETGKQGFFPRLVDPPADAGLLALRRLGCKMATGSGKTIVMAMLIAWAFCNRGRNPATTSFPNGVLVCAPNLTVKSRLQVLKPEDPGNYYAAFDLVPAKYRELLNAGRVHVTNWHVFQPKGEHREGDKSYAVVQKGEETPEAFAKDRLGELAGRLPILVLNDEGHHCWRPAPAAGEGGTPRRERDLTPEEKKALEEEAEEARVWLAGLDAINNAGLCGKDAGGKARSCIHACIDLSATPFYLASSGYPAGSPFPWLVNDFGLVDAIECGIVKIPRLPVFDDTTAKDEAGRPNPKFLRLWRNIVDDLKPARRLANGRPKPEAVFEEAQAALNTLASQWLERFAEIRKSTPAEAFIPPVLIVICDNTEIAQVFSEKISGERTVEVPKADGKGTEQRTIYGSSAILPELRNEPGGQRTVRIDSKLLARVEGAESETRDEAADALRRVINTVGKRGEPGEQVRCIVSVSMLTEGWDATNVTHILGVRAFESQLLCEQVVGRGLRRMDYTVDPQSGKLAAEHVDVYGIPFSLIPYKGEPKKDGKPDPVYHHIYPEEARARHEIRIPDVEGYTYDLKGAGIRCDVSQIPPMEVSDEPTRVYLTATRGYHDDAAPLARWQFVKQDRDAYYATVRPQQVVFKVAQAIVDDLVSHATGAKGKGRSIEASLLARHQIFPEIVRIVRQYVAERVQFAPGVDPRELGLEKYANTLRDRILAGILPAVAGGESPLLPIVNSFHPCASTADVDYRTVQPVVGLTKSHLNQAVVRSGLERRAIEILENLDCVEAFTPNDRNVGLRIPYEHEGGTYHYEPDFVVRVRGGKLVMVEIKGRGGEIHDEDRVHAKNVGAQKWVAAVNNAARWGVWAFEFVNDLAAFPATLEKHASGIEWRPFRIVQPKPEERFKTCVPLVSLRAAAGAWSEDQEQAGFDYSGVGAQDWVAFESSRPFETGMFVARVQGDSMEPEIRDRDYCLFRQPRGGTRQGRILLVRHAKISDPETGGHFTLKKYSSEKLAAGAGGWKHVSIKLSPLNEKYAPILLTVADEGDVRVVAELVEVVRTPSFVEVALPRADAQTSP